MGRKSSWQLAEFDGHSTPDGLRHLLAKSRWKADEIHDDLRGYVAEHLGADDGILIIDDTGFVKKGIASSGCNGSTAAPPTTAARASPSLRRAACR
ncbi:transposase [Streptomyces sp. NPDC127117]|uniref:transposase n=1 Tax=Streptomyces sp. NPDC127117 TaxID=3345368 RepID=UPI003644A71F